MKKFEFDITETLQRKIVIMAEDENEAYTKISHMYKLGEIVLDADDFIDSEINFSK
ncbi:MAG: DpnD/PcfM family protein [Sedimentibacter sp.]|uniref:DpnD/PcfM family protein n=1 Tax=Sedimentibacter sp. TaxID=1960295 RepID=UPI0029818727|nr:DpnD/PcfM family protein [Sedimentibacter sp.]MDW5300712.1 DpnD/PcfM family protein [Sedimentibacter sp.]